MTAEKIEISVPFPPSVNALFANRQHGKGRGRIATPAYTAWRTEAALRVNVQRPARIEGPVHLEYTLADKSRCDLGNLEKALTDLLVSSALIEGDGPKIVRSINLAWGDVEGARVVIRRAA